MDKVERVNAVVRLAQFLETEVINARDMTGICDKSWELLKEASVDAVKLTRKLSDAAAWQSTEANKGK